MAELTRNHVKDDKLYMGELEFTNLIKVLIRAFKFRNNNRNPEAIIIPAILEVDGVKVEFLGEVIAKTTGRKPGSNGNPGS